MEGSLLDYLRLRVVHFCIDIGKIIFSWLVRLTVVRLLLCEKQIVNEGAIYCSRCSDIRRGSNTSSPISIRYKLDRLSELYDGVCYQSYLLVPFLHDSGRLSGI